MCNEGWGYRKHMGKPAKRRTGTYNRAPRSQDTHHAPTPNTHATLVRDKERTFLSLGSPLPSGFKKHSKSLELQLLFYRIHCHLINHSCHLYYNLE